MGPQLVVEPLVGLLVSHSAVVAYALLDDAVLGGWATLGSFD